MSRAYNFSPGPATLPDDVMRVAQREFCDYADLRASVMEISHRGDAFIRVCRQAEDLLRELMDVPTDYWVLFLAGGASGQTAAIPLNLSENGDAAAYAISGHWSQRAADEAKKYCAVRTAAVLTDQGAALPFADFSGDAAYLHYVSNETVNGVEWAPPVTSPPLVADMSSNIMSRQVRVADHALIYASAQKNLGAAGVTVVIVRPDAVQARAQTPTIWNYRRQQERQSMSNTPPTFPIYLTGLVLQWVKQQGGVVAMEKRNEEKAALVYDCLDNSEFYRAQVPETGCRSIINIPFFLPNEELTALFLKEAAAYGDRGLIGLKGHAVLGGCRASMYNALPVAAAAALADFMRDFERRHG